MFGLILLLSFSFFALASARDVFILYPPGGENAHASLSFSIGDTLNATWQNSSDDPELVLWCTLNNGDQSRLSDIGGDGLKASGSFLIPLSYSAEDTSDRCHLQLTPGEDSVNFAVKASKDGATRTTWGLDQPTASSTQNSTVSSTASPFATSITTSTASTTPSAAPAPNPTSSGLSTAAKAGIGLGIGLAVVVGAAAIALVVLRRKNKPSVEAKSMPRPYETYYGPPPKQELPAWNTATEHKPVTESMGNLSQSFLERRL